VEYYDRRYNNKGRGDVERTDPFEYKHRRAAAASTIPRERERERERERKNPRGLRKKNVPH